MKILITNWHVPYIWMLAHTPHEFVVLNPPDRQWDTRMRPLPVNVTVADNDMSKLDKMRFDRILLQESDMVALNQFKRLGVPIIMLFHNSKQTNVRGSTTNYQEKVDTHLPRLLQGIQRVYISEFKKQSYELDGDVVLPGINPEEFGEWDGSGPYILSCVNNAQARDFMNGTQKMRIATRDLEWTMLGVENGQGLLAESFAGLKTYYQHARFFLALNEKAYEDGYNLSMLEAMMCGCPAVTLDHPTSPIEHGLNGYRSDDLQELNRLMRDTPHEKQALMGREARRTVIEKFPMDTFIDTWNTILERSSGNGRYRT